MSDDKQKPWESIEQMVGTPMEDAWVDLDRSEGMRITASELAQDFEVLSDRFYLGVIHKKASPIIEEMAGLLPGATDSPFMGDRQVVGHALLLYLNKATIVVENPNDWEHLIKVLVAVIDGIFPVWDFLNRPAKVGHTADVDAQDLYQYRDTTHIWVAETAYSDWDEKIRTEKSYDVDDYGRSQLTTIAVNYFMEKSIRHMRAIDQLICAAQADADERAEDLPDHVKEQFVAGCSQIINNVNNQK